MQDESRNMAVVERLVGMGAAALTDEELLHLASGCRRAKSGVGWTEILTRVGGLKGLLSMEVTALWGPGLLSRNQAQRLVAVRELGRRFAVAREVRPRLSTPEAVYEYLASRWRGLPREVFHVLSFNMRNVLLADTRVAVGTIDSCAVDPRDVFRAALAARATCVVLAHNHPSGDPEPSSLDVKLTTRLLSGAELLGIRVLDHLVVGDGSYVSFHERGWLHGTPTLTGVQECR